MSEESHPQHHRSFLDRMLHRGQHTDKDEGQHQDQQEPHGEESQKKDSEGELDKFKDYIESEDKRRGEEGDIYASLM
ncbi:hypothetical protein BDV28DRAFT_150533 [Aspergillus coremiiformis]|uniref:Uncharacterized protein n=1 Tax=Aspergillus coremiiformis TaxID=138285 RepID=A0A5N6Z4C8_9EURO|nr:hypothetical protein BDV28DRAFT_150533 [Aspergillus coremiiformis]